MWLWWVSYVPETVLAMVSRTDDNPARMALLDRVTEESRALS
ncbi:hypothetical protein AMETH_4542 [Amycolatopsis methanolica 239]|uniref:Uncharacterized protein n=1 Tax=Amycolatopsis methanolica 239 TaxID=1068978 RepID=A0A076MV94_AMYME|nr:hypothetical protein AMETH_4542 [Amycolatopsis methanolica 239]